MNGKSEIDIFFSFELFLHFILRVDEYPVSEQRSC